MLQRIIISVLLALSVVCTMAQGNADPYVNEADRYYAQMAYARAIPPYTTATELGAVNEHVTKRLAECHMRLGQTEEAEKWYAMVVKFLNREPVDLFHYAEALKSNGKYQVAEEWMDRYLAEVEKGEAVLHRSNIGGFARKFTADPDRFTVRNVAANSSFSDFGTAWADENHILFSSARKVNVGIERRASYNDQPFLDLFVADVTPSGDLVNARELEGDVNTKLHEGPATASANGDVIWFTRNELFNGRVKKSTSGILRLGIYKAHNVSGKWGNIEQFLYNNSETSVGHPAISPDGMRLFFVSDMPGGHGGSDIYVCKDMGGSWGEPENLGPAVNTPHNEVFPFIGADNTLYFASNGHPGLGGLDIFASIYKGLDGYAAPVNVGAPVNGPKDDFAFIINKDRKKGFFSSNRPGGLGDDDIYAFEMLGDLEQRFLCTGLVIDDETESPVVDIEVKLFDMDGRVVATARTDANGEYNVPVDKGKEYLLKVEMKGRYTGETHVSTEDIAEQQIITRDIHMIPDAGIWIRGTAHYQEKIGFVPGVTVTVVNMSSFFTESQTTGEGGDINMRLQSNEEFEVLLEKPGYYSISLPISTIGMKNGIILLNDLRQLDFEPILIGTPVPFKQIRWAHEGTDLDQAAKIELDQFAERLNTNPLVKVEIGVHSDARDTNDPAKRDQKRAASIVSHLVKKGVKKDRLTEKGYGISRLKNHCAPGVQCSEAEHAENRRVEFTVTDVFE